MKFILIFLLLNFYIFTNNSQSIPNITTTSLPTTTNISPWDQAYLEVFGYLPSDHQYSTNSTLIPEETSTQKIEIDGPSPSLTYEFKNGSVAVFGNLTNTNSNIDRPITLAPTTSIPIKPNSNCRDRAKNCVETRRMCNDKLYEATLTELCAFTCGRCGACVDQSTSCIYWKTHGYCNTFAFTSQYRQSKCARTCNLCS